MISNTPSIFSINEPFLLECGETLPKIDIAWQSYGKPNGKNTVWICHALTANADPVDWWPGLVGSGFYFDPERWHIVCANMLGSCYGTTGPTSLNPLTGKAYSQSWPIITIRDMVRAHILLRKHLAINTIHLIIGGSMGGQQALEWSLIEPDVIENLCLLATNAVHSPWGIAFNEAQRMALNADNTLNQEDGKGGANGLKAARAIAMLSYRGYEIYNKSQAENDNQVFRNYKVSGYQQHQGNKLANRFYALSYKSLTQSMDSHNVGRNRGDIASVLQSIRAKTLVIGISSDILFPPAEQSFLAQNIPNAKLEIIDSIYGHDGFLVEFQAIHSILSNFITD